MNLNRFCGRPISGFMPQSQNPRTDCTHYRGEKPCRFRRDCAGCPEYQPQGTRILVIKLGAMGDVLRTTPVLPALKKGFPQSQITWVTDESCLELLRGVPAIDRLLALDFSSTLVLTAERFDRLYCFDKVPEATALGNHCRADVKKGFRLTVQGTLGICDDDSLYALRLGLSDPLKFFENQRTYQDVLFQMAGLRYEGEPYQFVLSDADRTGAAGVLDGLPLRPGRPLVGLNVGCGSVFLTKQWEPTSFINLARLLHTELGADILLLGGIAEKDRMAEIAKRSEVPVYGAGWNNPVKGFAAILERCDVVVTGDTLAMHLAIALNTSVVALFGSTCPQEIDLYGKGIKLFSGADCSPCYRHKCADMKCMNAITEAEVLRAVKLLLTRQKTDSLPRQAGRQ